MANSPSTELPTRNDPDLLIERQKGDQHNWPIVLGDTLVWKPSYFVSSMGAKLPYPALFTRTSSLPKVCFAKHRILCSSGQHGGFERHAVAIKRGMRADRVSVMTRSC